MFSQKLTEPSVFDDDDGNINTLNVFFCLFLIDFSIVCYFSDAMMVARCRDIMRICSSRQLFKTTFF